MFVEVHLSSAMNNQHSAPVSCDLAHHSSVHFQRKVHNKDETLTFACAANSSVSAALCVNQNIGTISLGTFSYNLRDKKQNN